MIIVMIIVMIIIIRRTRTRTRRRRRIRARTTRRRISSPVLFHKGSVKEAKLGNDYSILSLKK